jgi:hypothetical protein
LESKDKTTGLKPKPNAAQESLLSLKALTTPWLLEYTNSPWLVVLRLQEKVLLTNGNPFKTHLLGPHFHGFILRPDQIKGTRSDNSSSHFVANISASKQIKIS